MMNERNTYSAESDGGRTLEQIISHVAEQEFAEIPYEPMTPEKLAAMAAARRAARRRAKRRLLSGIAAMLVLVLIGAVAAFNAFSVDVGADKNQKEEVKTEDGVIVEDGGYGAVYEDGSVWRTNDWDDIAMAKGLYPQLLIPEYIPEGYGFEQLTIEHIKTGDTTSEYIFSNGKGKMLEIEMIYKESGEMSLDINDISKTMKCSRGTIYIQQYENKIATIQIDGGISVFIWSDLSDEELVKIIDNLSN